MHYRIRRSLFSYVLCCAALAPAASLALDKVRIGMGALSPTNAAIWVAEERGIFKKHGLDVTIRFAALSPA